MKSLLVVAGVVVAAFLTIAQFGTAGWSFPPIAAQQHGFRGTGMDQIQTKREAVALKDANQAPAPADPADAGGDKAGTTYQNVQVLKDLSTEQFNRVMTSMTEWVAPEQGCTYCHNTENMASDDLYQKKVARRMLQMTQYINTNWKEKHVNGSGVTCYTCHRGQPVPKNIWFENPGLTAKGLTQPRNNGQNMASPDVGLASLPYDTLTEYLGKKDVNENAIRVNATTALPEGKGKPIQEAEKTYGLMMHMSQSLGVNCTYCHNTRAISQWSQSTPQRTTAWYGIRMVRALNGDYLEPLKGTFPPNRLGPTGDVPKVGCGTCHNGQPKPLNGAHVIDAYPELAKATASAADAKPAPASPPADAPK
ncbi:photosynthetic reaction center cytochrome PufC [Methylobacterium haplocladii]|uniref:Photosynthetic reaction center cytochrome c subunit n=1 Tax=Methylobacterium haplocladii TaxID=1176176 RepID=A0A512IQT3_9HYPH|nr:photosynthetic reaction center cytochrome PufC [Methylobacterium haplocladii]GEP00060.1 hypothetical protein MHA02_24470 [Methylobacterium haplocladii]GLS59331.1 hypothetical protein GCM10007887_19970 [Methylobacterium haplocladii]